MIVTLHINIIDLNQLLIHYLIEAVKILLLVERADII
jgi:hypothetical protein